MGFRPIESEKDCFQTQENMTISFIAPENWIWMLALRLKEYGVSICFDHCDENCDFIVGMSVSVQDKIWEAHAKYPHIPMINYNWDLYSWQFEKPREGEYDWKTYGQLLGKSIEVWCPSACTVQRMKDFFGLENGKVLKTFVPVDHLHNVEKKDSRYVLSALREIPDKNYGWTEKACEELGIPCVSTKANKFSKEEFKKVLAECSFIVSAYYEASTGGLSLIEGLYLEKPCLISDSPWMGAKDYLGDRANYFKHDDFEDLKKKIQNLWDDTPKLAFNRDFVLKNYGLDTMALSVKERLDELSRISG